MKIRHRGIKSIHNGTSQKKEYLIQKSYSRKTSKGTWIYNGSFILTIRHGGVKILTELLKTEKVVNTNSVSWTDKP
jgi:hypothetical protein